MSNTKGLIFSTPRRLVWCTFDLSMFIFEKNPKNLQKPVEYSPTDGMGTLRGGVFQGPVKFLEVVMDLHDVCPESTIFSQTNVCKEVDFLRTRKIWGQDTYALLRTSRKKKSTLHPAKLKSLSNNKFEEKIKIRAPNVKQFYEKKTKFYKKKQLSEGGACSMNFFLNLPFRYVFSESEFVCIAHLCLNICMYTTQYS